MTFGRTSAGKSVHLARLIYQLFQEENEASYDDLHNFRRQCIGCIYKNNSSAHVLNCAVHPSGPGQEGCPDFQSEQ